MPAAIGNSFDTTWSQFVRAPPRRSVSDAIVTPAASVQLKFLDLVRSVCRQSD